MNCFYKYNYNYIIAMCLISRFNQVAFNCINAACYLKFSIGISIFNSLFAKG